MFGCQHAPNPRGKTTLQILSTSLQVSWPYLKSHLSQHPSEASETDRFGVTALHHAIRKHSSERRHRDISLHVMERLVELYPEGIRKVDSMNGCNALHLACLVDDYQVVDMILKVDPDAARVSSPDDRIPLHRAQSLQVATRLVECFPQGVTVKAIQYNAYLPLHCVCSSTQTSPEVVQYLIETGRDLFPNETKIPKDGTNIKGTKRKEYPCGGLLIQDSHGNLPLQVLYRRMHFATSGTTSNRSRSHTNGSDRQYLSGNGEKGALHHTKQSQEEQLWSKLILVAKETYLARKEIFSNHNEHSQTPRVSDDSPQTRRDVPIVHAILETGGSLRIVKHVLNLYPQDIVRRDADDGATLLMLAVSNVSTEPELLTFLLDAEEQWKGNQSQHTKQDFERTVASVPNKKGRLPLHQAVISGRTLQNGVRELVQAEPRAVETRDVETSMYPFCLAAIPSFRWDNTCMDTVYELLRHAPHLLHQYCE